MGLFFSFSLCKTGVREVMFAKHQLAIVLCRFTIPPCRNRDKFSNSKQIFSLFFALECNFSGGQGSYCKKESKKR